VPFAKKELGGNLLADQLGENFLSRANFASTKYGVAIWCRTSSNRKRVNTAQKVMALHIVANSISVAVLRWHDTLFYA
jgi:hypothetical protein